MNAVYLETERLLLTKLDTNFYSNTYVDWMNDRDVIKYLESGGGYSNEDLKQFLISVEKKNILFWAITDKESQKHIGNIKIDPISIRHRRGEYGILIGNKNFWGKGIGFEASKVVIDYCFSSPVSLNKITLGVVTQNISGIHLYEKLGFKREGILKHHVNYHGVWYDVIRMAVFNSDIR